MDQTPNKKKVLILKQFEPMQNVIAQLLYSTKLQLAPITFVKSLQELPRAATGQSFNAVISDLVIEDAAGLKLLDSLEAAFPKMRILFICEFGRWEQEMHEAENRGHYFVNRDEFLAEAQTLAGAYLSLHQEAIYTNKQSGRNGE